MVESVKKTAKHIWLHRTETSLREQLDIGDIPFLGLYLDVFSDAARKYFQENVVSNSSPIGSYIIGLNRWPATFATYLTIHVVEGYGKSGTAAVYPFVRSALRLGSLDLTQLERERLWRAYRSACVTLGLSVVPIDSNYRPMVLEYLRQAGVPIRYLSKLFERYTRLAKMFGMPDPEDPEELREWQQNLNISYLQKPVIQAIENDQDAYYGSLFVRVSGFQSANEAKSSVERVAYESINKLDRTVPSRHKSLIPRLEWRDGELGISLPASEQFQWSIEIEQGDSELFGTQTVRGDQDPQFVPIFADLPTTITVTTQGVKFSLIAWASTKNNRLLLFDRSGRFVSSGALGDNPILIRPGQYSLLTRWQPPELADVAFKTPGEHSIFASPIQLQAASKLTLTRGPAQLEIVARDVPTLEWIGTRLVGMLGREVYSGNELALGLSVPSEILHAAINGLELVIRERGGADIAIPIEKSCIESGEVTLSKALTRVSLGVRRVTIRLRRPDIPNRSLATISAYIWNGLITAVPGRFRCVSEKALNINRSLSHNVRLNTQSVSYADSEQRFFRTVFDTTNGETAAFNWPVPGVFVFLEESRSGQTSERPLKNSEVIQIHPGSRQKLKIYSTERGSLTLGAFSYELRDALLGGTQVYLAALADYVSPDHQILRLKLANSGVELDLVRLVTPHEIVSYATKHTADNHQVNFQVAGILNEFLVTSLNVISGIHHKFHIIPDDFKVVGHQRSPILLTTTRIGDKTTARLECFLNEWKPGEWVHTFRAKIDGRWGNLVNTRGDVFASSSRIGQDAHSSWHTICNDAVQDRIEVFERLTALCLQCFSQESWYDIRWISDLWDALAATFKQDGNSQSHRLLGLALREVSETASESWVPIKSVAASCHWIFSLPWSTFENFSRGSGASRRLFAAGTRLSVEGSKLLQEGFLDPLMVLAFDRGPLFLKDPTQYLGKFSLARYSDMATYTGEYERRRVLASIEWRPAPGDYLGARHYWWAVRELANALKRTATGNEYRRGSALRITQRLRNIGARGVHPRLESSHIADRLSLGVLDPWCSDETKSDQESENLCGFIDLISLLAYVARLNQRTPDDTICVFQELGNIIDMDETRTREILGFVMYIGMDLVVYYLSLWEFVLALHHREKS